jgi:hypothetical protein
VTVAPLTATVLADAGQADAGIASAVNDAVARVGGLIGVSAIGVVVARTLVGDSFAARLIRASVPRGDRQLRSPHRLPKVELFS